MNQPSYSILKKGGDTFTSKEIERQPKTWKKTWKKIKKESGQISSFLNRIKDISNLNIILTGAGSSAFIGDVITSVWLKYFACPVQAIPTTDLVTHFKDRIATGKPLLLISFARSGNSPESTAAIQRANQYCKEVYHLIITCNREGQLAEMASEDNHYVFLLPGEAEDKSLAMTNSFTSMTLSGILIPSLITKDNETIDNQIALLSSYGKEMIESFQEMLLTIAKLDFNRVVFLGSGPLLGIARESHLKVQELTNGKVIGKFDSFLGFRHGPKAIINDNTLMVYLMSNVDNIYRYEKDLINQIDQHNINMTTVAMTEKNTVSDKIDYCINFNSQGLNESLWAILCTLPAQIIGLYKSLLLGYNPDNPSPDGTISRVVEGVTIYNDGNHQPSK